MGRAGAPRDHAGKHTSAGCLLTAGGLSTAGGLASRTTGKVPEADEANSAANSGGEIEVGETIRILIEIPELRGCRTW